MRRFDPRFRPAHKQRFQPCCTARITRAHNSLFRINSWPTVLPGARRRPHRRLAGRRRLANIRVADCNGNMWGVVSWEKTPGGRDTNNPDPAKQSRPTLGMPILLDMKKKPGAEDGKARSTTPRTARRTPRPSACRRRPARDQGLRDGLPVRRRDLDPRRSADSLEPRQRMAKGARRAPTAAPKAAGPRPKTTGSTAPTPTQAPVPEGPADRPRPPITRRRYLPTPDIARFAHQRRLEQQHGRERGDQRERQQLAHARRAGMARQPEAAERRCRRQRAEEDRARQARLQQVRLPGAPGQT